MSGVTDLSDADLATMLQQKLDEAKAMQPSSVTNPAPQGVLQNMGAGFMGMLRGVEKVLSLPEKAGYAAGSAVTDATGSPEAGYATNVAIQAAPGLVGGALNLGGRLLRGPAEALMQSAMKPSLKDLSIPGKVGRATDTWLTRGNNPLLPGSNITPSGVETLRGMGVDANNAAQTAVNASNADISGPSVMRGLNRPTNEAMNYGDPQSTLAQIDQIGQNFANHPAIGDFNAIPVQQAQKLKQGFYKQVDDAYGMPDIGGTTMARKGLANALKMQIEQAVPDVVGPNAEASSLWNAINVAKRRAMVSGNRDPLGFAPFAHDPAGALAYLFLRSPAAKSQLARALNASQGGVGMAAGTAPSVANDLTGAQ